MREGAWKVLAPALASKLSRVISMVDILFLQTATTTSESPRLLLGQSELTGSLFGSSASGRTSTAHAKPRKSRLQTLTPTSPAKKPASAKKTLPKSCKKSKNELEEDKLHQIESYVAGLPNPKMQLDDNLSNVNNAWSSFWSECTDAYVATDMEKKVEIEIDNLTNAPADFNSRAIEEAGIIAQRNYLVSLADFNNKQALCMMPDMAYKPKDLESIPDGTKY